MVNGKKVLAIFLIFTLMFAHSEVVTESIATTNFVSLFGTRSDTGSENVEFEAYLTDGEKTSNALVSDVNNENLGIQLQLDVKKSGYLKNGKVEIKAEDNKELNFAIQEDNHVAESESVQSLTDNVLEFNKINNSSDSLLFSIPIEYEMEEYINEQKLKNNAKVIFSGTYVDSKGKENEILKEVELTLAWKDNRTVNVEEEVSKYVRYGDNGIILQTIVRVDSTNENKNSLPTKETELNINVPKIDNRTPAEVTVIANSTIGTNGKSVGEVEFSSENCGYDKETGMVTIKLENTKQLVDVNQSDEYLKVEEEEKQQEERYYSKAGIDEYVLTYTYQNVQITDEMSTSSNLQAKVITFSGVEAENMENVITAEKTNEYLLTGQTGNIVSYYIENETPEISKIYGYLNKEVEYDSKTSINISYTDIVEEIIVEDIENDYIDKSGNKISTDDIYYKQISINQENFNQILGEEGNIQLLDDAGNLLTTISNQNTIDENGNYVVDFQSKISKVKFKTSAPISTGNLIIASKKATTDKSISKADYANMEAISTTTLQKAKFTYVSDIVELGNCIAKTNLKDTLTDFNFVIDRDNLSTITTNSNVEMRLELNNDKENSDIYGNSVFEVEMPEYITGLNLISSSILYGEGLELASVEPYVRDERIVIRVTINGTQTDLNSGVLTNGTNIVLNADIDVDMYAPSIKTAIKASCNNSEATNYAVESKEAEIEYSAPSGVVAINTTSNYNNVGAQLTSIKQGEQVDYIDIYSEAKKATMEIVVMNNNENSISDLAILGRIPFEGVKDLTTGEDLGTTLDTKMVNGIIPNANNQGEFTVYYSDNKEATKDLDNTSNGWTANPVSLENVKSYLIIPTDNNYKMEKKQVLRFTYEYEIPANLNHNEDIYGTFLASYTVNTESKDLEEDAKPDLIGLTTGAGPELELNLKTDVSNVKENDQIKITATVKNIGQDVAQNVLVKLPVPNGTIFVSSEANRDMAKVEYMDGNVVANIEQLVKNAEVEINAIVKVGSIYEEDTTKVFVTATAKDLSTELKSNEVEIKLEVAEMSIEQFIDREEEENFYYEQGDSFDIILRVENLREKMQKNVKVETTLPKELEVVKAFMVNKNEQGEYVYSENATYDSKANKVTWNKDTIEADAGQTMKITAKVKNLEEGITAKTLQILSQVSAEKTEVYLAEDIVMNIGKSSVSIIQTSSTPTYVKEGEMINYTFTIKNEGSTIAQDVVLTDMIPEGLVVREISYEIDGMPSVSKTADTDETSLTLSIPANDEVDVNVIAFVASLNGEKEKTITNVGTISNVDAEDITSNSVTHIIQATEDSDNSELYDDEDETTYYQTDITKSHKITGIAWLDSNKNGMRDDGEQRMSGITAMLVDSESGVIKATKTTNENGEYAFTGLQNGSYLVLFKYDTSIYTTTTYRKEGVESNINSDVVTTKIEQNGKKENGAVTDVIYINGANISNIDIGFAESAQFSLGIDKNVTKVTVQNAQGSVTEEFNKTKLAKYDIASKYLSGTTVYVEYLITVTNNGELEGFASEVVDYIPAGMTFNSNLNPDWYTGTDGSLYTKALANSELAPGESKDIRLVLTKKMTAENTAGIVSNTAEIAEDFNIYGVSDKNSVPANKAQGEDDISTADIILTVKTGETLIYLSAIIISLLIGGAIAFVVYEKLLKNKNKGGV